MFRHKEPAIELGEYAVAKRDMKGLERRPAPPARPKGALALVGAWREVEDKELESLIEDIYAGRQKDMGRRVDLLV